MGTLDTYTPGQDIVVLLFSKKVSIWTLKTLLMLK